MLRARGAASRRAVPCDLLNLSHNCIGDAGAVSLALLLDARGSSSSGGGSGSGGGSRGGGTPAAAGSGAAAVARWENRQRIYYDHV